MNALTDDGDQLVAVLLDTAWVDQTRHQVAAEFDCAVCLDFRHLADLGPCPACDPDGYAEHIDELLTRHGQADKAVG